MTHEAQTRLPWTAEEDAILISLVERYGEKRWNMVANGLPGRTGKGCSHRWRTYLRPDVKHPHLEPFTEWEAATIVQAQREMGNNWLAIAKLLLPGRSNTAVKNFWHCRLKSGSGTNTNRFIVEGYGLRYLLSEVPHEERIHPVALPAFPSTAPTGQLHHHHKQEQHMVDINQLAQSSSLMPAGQDALTAEAYSAGMDPAAMDMSGSLMGLNPAAAGLPAGLGGGGAAAPPVAIPPPDPSLDPKEDLKRRASAYVQQQLARMGQPASKGGGSSSSRRDSVTHTGAHSHHVGNMGSATSHHIGWSGASGSFSMGGSGAGMAGPGYKKGSGRGRGRRPGQRNRCSSDDDPNDETYVPSGRYIKAEHVNSRDDVTTRHSDPSAGCSSMTQAYLHGDGDPVRHGMGSSTGMVPHHMMDHGIAAHPAGECYYSSQGMQQQQQQQQYYEPDHAVMGHHHISDGGTITSAHLFQHQQQHQHYQQQPGMAVIADGPPWQEAAPGYSMPADYTAAAAAATGASGGMGAAYQHPPLPQGTYTVTTAATVAAMAKRPSLLGLEDTAVAYEAFRQSGGDFKVSIGCLDELLSGGTGPHAGGDWNGVAGLFRGTSLDGSRFSLTGSAEAAGGVSHHPGRSSSRGGAYTSAMPPLQHHQQHPQHCQPIDQHGQVHYQMQQQQHLEMPPPRYHQGSSGHIPGTNSRAFNHGHSAAATAIAATESHQGPPCGSVAQGSSGNSLPGVAGDAVPADVRQEAAATQGLACGPTPDVTHGPTQPYVTHGTNPEAGRCESPFKAAALQQPPFSPALKDDKPANATGFTSTQTAPSSQATQCSTGNMLSQLQHGSYNNLQQAADKHPQLQQQQQPGDGIQSVAGSQSQRAAPGMPATFHNVLQALGGPQATAAPTAAGISIQMQTGKMDSGAAKPAGTATQPGLQLHYIGEVIQRRSRASFGLLSPVGNIFADATEGCLTLDDAMGSMYATSANGGSNTQTKAERRSLRLLLGVLASTPDAQDPMSWGGATAAPADTAALNAADDLTFMRRSSHGGSLAGTTCIQKPGGNSSSGRPSLSILPPSGRPSQRGVVAIPGGVVTADLGFNEYHKRPRMSLTLTSPNGVAAKRPRVSLAGVVTGRVSSGTAEYDECLSYWQN